MSKYRRPTPSRFDRKLLEGWMASTCWKVGDLADEMGVTGDAARNWLKGFNAPNFDGLVALREVSRIPADGFVMGTKANEKARAIIGARLRELGREVPWKTDTTPAES